MHRSACICQFGKIRYGNLLAEWPIPCHYCQGKYVYVYLHKIIIFGEPFYPLSHWVLSSWELSTQDRLWRRTYMGHHVWASNSAGLRVVVYDAWRDGVLRRAAGSTVKLKMPMRTLKVCRAQAMSWLCSCCRNTHSFETHGNTQHDFGDSLNKFYSGQVRDDCS